MSEAIYHSFEANDGEKLSYQSHGKRRSQALLLLHGFTGSSQYFIRNFESLSSRYWVIAPDHRGHGSSTKAKHGYHVARLAMDVKNLLDHIKSTVQYDVRFVGIGCSLGAAILWAYAELFNSQDFAGMMFVDQAPLQDYIPDGSWSISHGNYGCHDAASLAWAQATLTMRPDDFYRGLVQGCLAYRFMPSQSASHVQEEVEADESFFVDISREGHGQWFAKLLANHTSYDHRDTLASLIDCPCVIMAGKYSGSFPVAGICASTDLINSRKPGLARNIVVESGHWMFYEDPTLWSAHVLESCGSFFSPEVEG